MHIRKAHATYLETFHGKLVLFAVVQRQCAIAPLGSNASRDRGCEKRNFSRRLVLRGHRTNYKQQSTDQCQAQDSITPTNHGVAPYLCLLYTTRTSGTSA